jgi:CheY-specific phosphatase CheX
MQTGNKEVVSEVFCNVIEQIAFMFAEVASLEDMAGMDQAFVEASMSFDGQLRGRLRMAVPKDACAQIAGNVLGMEPDDPFVTRGAADSLKELLNVTCGHILTSLAGDRPVFDLSIPQVSDLDEQAVQSLLAEPDTVAFRVEDAPVLVRLEMREG